MGLNGAGLVPGSSGSGGGGGSGTVSDITSTDDSFVITSPTGPTTNLSNGIPTIALNGISGVDPSGSTDSTRGINNAKNTGGTTSILQLGIGTYKVGTATTTTTTTTANIVSSCPATFTMASTSGFYNGPGQFDVAVGSGTAIIAYTAVSGATLTGCSYVTGGTGALTSGATVTLEIGNFTHDQGLIGPGAALCQFQYSGFGTCINITDGTSFNTSTSIAGPHGGYQIEGNSNPFSVGLAFGNMNRARMTDITCDAFTGTNGIGINLKNVGAAWQEEGVWIGIRSGNSTTALVFDSQSHDYNIYDFNLGANANQTCFSAINNSSCVGSFLHMYGNCITGGTNTGIAMNIGNSSSDTTSFNCTYAIGFETDGGTTAHQCIKYNISGNGVSGLFGTGSIQFIGTVPFQPITGITGTATVAVSGNVSIPGLGVMNPSGDALMVPGGSLWQVFGTATTQPFSNDIFWEAGDINIGQYPSGANTLSFQATPASTNLVGKRCILIAVQPSSGGAATFVWPGTVVWLHGTPKTTTINSDYDVFDFMYVPQSNIWYGRQWPKSTDTQTNAITATSNAATVPITYKNNNVTNSSSATCTITLTTTGAVDNQPCIVKFYDFAGTAETLTWVNTENSTVTVPGTSNGSTTLPITAAFMFNAATTKWRCVGVA